MGRFAASFVLLALVAGCKTPPKATMDGKALFEGTCARCHGADGTGGLPVFDGGPSPQNFHDHAFQMARTDDQLKQTIKNGKGTAMPPFGAIFDDKQLSDLVVQIRSFDKAP